MSFSKVSYSGSTCPKLNITQLQCRFEKLMGRPLTITDVLLLSTIVSTFFDPSVTATPTNGSTTYSVSNGRIVPVGPEFWTEPCGGPVTGDPSLSDAEAAATFKLELEIALNYLKQWINDYCYAKFFWTFDQKVESDKPFRYEWLQVNSTIPKQPGEQLNETYYSTQKLNTMFTESSNLLQRIAIGWEQVDIEKTDSQFKNQFTNTKGRMTTTLCTLAVILAGKGLSPAPNPTRSIMPDELRAVTSASARDERNFRILKEYVVTLEYYADGFGYYEKLLQTTV